MKKPIILVSIVIFLAAFSSVEAQRNRSRIPSKSKPTKSAQTENEAIIIDRRLAVLRIRPSLYAVPVQRMSVGRKVSVIGTKEADGVMFYQIRISRNTTGWMQSDAVIGKFRKDDDQRLFKLMQASDGFDQVDKVVIFLEQFQDSQLRSPTLLLLGDLMEDEALRLSKKAAKDLDRREMAASGAPLHSFYLNHPSLDRYGRIGVQFLFNLDTKNYHYNGDSWFEIIRKYPKSNEADEAQKRLDKLKLKMETKKP